MITLNVDLAKSAVLQLQVVVVPTGQLTLAGFNFWEKGGMSNQDVGEKREIPACQSVIAFVNILQMASLQLTNVLRINKLLAGRMGVSDRSEERRVGEE